MINIHHGMSAIWVQRINQVH